jgi:hypothetical protein
VQASGPFAGSISGSAKAPFAGTLSFIDAIHRGLDFNLGTEVSPKRFGRLRGSQRSFAAACFQILTRRPAKRSSR